MEVFDQAFLVERLTQHPDRACLEYPQARSLFRGGRNEYDRRAIAVGDQLALQLNPAQTGHLDIGDHTPCHSSGSTAENLRPRQKWRRRNERSHESFGCFAYGFIN
jgi:hypothetical protein